jgi:hypothetical protein
MRKKHGKFLKIPDMPAAAAWKFLKISLRRRRRGCIHFLSAAAAATQPIGLHLYPSCCW